MNKLKYIDSCGKKYTAHRAIDPCRGCDFLHTSDDTKRTTCTASHEVYCGGLIWKEATDEELVERDTLDTKGLRIALLVNIAIWVIIYFVFIN